MFELKIESLTLNMPDQPNELTLGQFLKLREEKDIITQLAILCSVDKEDLLNIKYSPKAEKQLQDAIKLTEILNDNIRDYFNSDACIVPPVTVTIMNKVVRVPQDLEKEPFWPSRKVKEVIQEKIQETGTGVAFDPTDKAADVIAHYLYVPFTGRPYNEYQAEEFKEVIHGLPLTDAIPLANFFFLKWKSLYLTRFSCFLTELRMWRKKLVSKYLRSTKMLTSWSLLAMATSYCGIQ